MANPSKQKGTAGETELRRLLEEHGLSFVRTPSSSTYDLTNQDPNALELTPLEVLAGRADREEWLVTLRLSDFAYLLSLTEREGGGVWETHIEVKRYVRIAWHRIFFSKFGRSK